MHWIPLLAFNHQPHIVEEQVDLIVPLLYFLQKSYLFSHCPLLHQQLALYFLALHHRYSLLLLLPHISSLVGRPLQLCLAEAFACALLNAFEEGLRGSCFVDEFLHYLLVLLDFLASGAPHLLGLLLGRLIGEVPREFVEQFLDIVGLSLR